MEFVDASTGNAELYTIISVGEHHIQACERSQRFKGASGYIANEFTVNMTVLS